MAEQSSNSGMPPFRVSLRDIAKATGLHFTTVALALRDSPKIRLQTREKVKEVAHSLGYRPDAMLAALNAYRVAKRTPHYQATIGWINYCSNRRWIYGVYDFVEYYKGARERAEQLGYILEEFWMHEEGMTPAGLQHILMARNIRGLLIAPYPTPRGCPGIDYSEFAAVAFGYSMQPAVLNVVTNHQTHSMRMAIENIVRMGYRRPGLCISAVTDEKVENSWLETFTFAPKKHPSLAQIPPLMIESYKGDAFRKWMHKYKPDVVIGFGGTQNNDAYDGLEAMGFHPPHDIGFVNMSVKDGDAHFSGIDQNHKLVGIKAIDLVVDMIHRGEYGIPKVPMRLLVESTWMPGETLSFQPSAEAVPVT